MLGDAVNHLLGKTLGDEMVMLGCVGFPEQVPVIVVPTAIKINPHQRRCRLFHVRRIQHAGFVVLATIGNQLSKLGHIRRG